MKKFLATAVAAGALMAAGAASAQDIGNIAGSILSNIFGLGNTTSQTTVYQDQYGRRFYYDQYGRAVYLQDQQAITGYDQWGRPIYGSSQNIVGYDQWGRPVYGSSTAPYGSTPYGTYAYGSRYYGDRDGDGVPDSADRWPDDARYR